MKADDLAKMKELFPRWKETTKDVSTICVHSPAGSEVSLISELFPLSEIVLLNETRWNLLGPAPQKFDLFVTNNTFMYSTNPQAWFDNVLASCRYAWIQDIVRGRRDPEKECGGDGDSMRYKYEPDAVARLPEAYDLHKLDKHIREFVTWESTGSGQYDSVHFYLFLEKLNVIESKNDQRDSAVPTRSVKKAGQVR